MWDLAILVGAVVLAGASLWALTIVAGLLAAFGWHQAEKVRLTALVTLLLVSLAVSAWQIAEVAQ